MPLAKGERLGPYEVSVLVGEGGMGEVYRATDTRLGRTVAVKVIKGQFSDRFSREARAISALNHPNICTLHDVGVQGDLSYLVMEYVDGKPLKGPLPVEEALRLGIQITSALAAAHRAAIVHRDLKPANILLTNSGVKLLDFGLAKFAQPVISGIDATVTGPVTAKGQIVGTLQYMAPEQVEGLEADARSDIFSFGIILYELLTGRRPFEGNSAASVIASILKEDPPPLGTLQPLSPPALERTLAKCLEKDPERRWQSVSDLRDELVWISENAKAAPQHVTRRSLLPWIAGSAAAGALASGLAVRSWREKTGTVLPPAARFRLPLPENVWPDRMVTRQTMALSPVGGRLAFIGGGETVSRIWVQRIDSLTSAPLAGTENARMLFWSADGRMIGFLADGKLKKVSVDGGLPLPICDLFEAWSATWGLNGQIIATSPRERTAIIHADAGTITPWKKVFWPSFLPDGRHVLYVELDTSLPGYRGYIEEMESGRRTALPAAETPTLFCPDSLDGDLGYLLYCRNSTLLAQPFSVKRLAVTGQAVSLAQGIPFFRPALWSEFFVSHDGILVFSSGIPMTQAVWLDRSGREIEKFGQPQPFWGDFRLSRDGSHLCTGIFDGPNGGVDLWVYDLHRGTSERITFQTGVEAMSSWSPDGTRIVYGNAQASGPQLRIKSIDEKGEGMTFPPGPFQLPFDWSADGRWIVYQTSGGDTNSEMWVASVPDRKIMPLMQGAFDTSQPSLSPDSKLIAFAANETGRREVYVQHFDGGDSPRVIGERKRVSMNGGYFPRWCGGGKELVFLSHDREVMSAEVRDKEVPEFSTPVKLFHLPASFRPIAPTVPGFEVFPDGKKFLVLTGRAAADPLHVIVNWQSTLKRG